MPKTLRLHFGLKLFGIVFAFPIIGYLTSQYMEESKYRASLEENENRAVNLEFELESMIQEIKYKENTVELFLAHDIRLKDAAETFLAIDENQSNKLANLRANYVGKSDLEREARLFIHLVNTRTRDSAAIESLEQRVNEEFDELFPDAESLVENSEK